jgi:SAM-dependent methyltransferase
MNNMEEEELRSIAEQLRKPSGEFAVTVAGKMNEGNQLINQYTLEALKLNAGGNILEIGMGNGKFVKNILDVDKSVNYTGCDFSKEMVEEAEKINRHFIEAGRAAFIKANADNLPFGDDRFNKVFSVNTLYFWDNPPEVLAEIRRVLKPDGELVIGIRPLPVMKQFPFVKFGFTLYSGNKACDLLIQNGFNVLQIIEKKEPVQDLNGVKINVESLILCASVVK